MDVNKLELIIDAKGAALDMLTVRRARKHVQDIAESRNLPVTVRMSYAQSAAYESLSMSVAAAAGIEARATISEALEARPLTMAGYPIVQDWDYKANFVRFDVEFPNGRVMTLCRIDNLAVPEGFA